MNIKNFIAGLELIADRVDGTNFYNSDCVAAFILKGHISDDEKRQLEQLGFEVTLWHDPALNNLGAPLTTVSAKDWSETDG
jgi:hypothetical protein